jgi:hypothetical protein
LRTAERVVRITRFRRPTRRPREHSCADRHERRRR